MALKQPSRLKAQPKGSQPVEDTSIPPMGITPKPKKKQRGYGQAQEGRGGYSHGGSVSSRLSKAGPVGKPN